MKVHLKFMDALAKQCWAKSTWANHWTREWFMLQGTEPLTVNTDGVEGLAEQCQAKMDRAKRWAREWIALRAAIRWLVTVKGFRAFWSVQGAEGLGKPVSKGVVHIKGANLLIMDSKVLEGFLNSSGHRRPRKTLECRAQSVPRSGPLPVYRESMVWHLPSLCQLPANEKFPLAV